MKPVGVTVVDGGGGGGCVYMLKKKPWLRAFHIIMMRDTSKFLLDAFGNPVSFNRVDEHDDFIWGLADSILNGYRNTLGNDKAKVRIECIVSLSMLCLCPWVYGKSTPAKLTVGKQYKIGREKQQSTIGGGMSLIKSTLKGNQNEQ